MAANCSRVMGLSGEKVVSLVPLTMLLPSAQMTASAYQLPSATSARGLGSLKRGGGLGRDRGGRPRRTADRPYPPGQPLPGTAGLPAGAAGRGAHPPQFVSTAYAGQRRRAGPAPDGRRTGHPGQSLPRAGPSHAAGRGVTRRTPGFPGFFSGCNLPLRRCNRILVALLR